MKQFNLIIILSLLLLAIQFMYSIEAAVGPLIPLLPAAIRVGIAALPAVKSGLQVANKASSRGVGASGDPKIHKPTFNSPKKAEEAARHASHPLG
jgi:hypothetical protein